MHNIFKVLLKVFNTSSFYYFAYLWGLRTEYYLHFSLNVHYSSRGVTSLQSFSQKKLQAITRWWFCFIDPPPPNQLQQWGQETRAGLEESPVLIGGSTALEAYVIGRGQDLETGRTWTEKARGKINCNLNFTSPWKLWQQVLRTLKCLLIK